MILLQNEQSTLPLVLMWTAYVVIMLKSNTGPAAKAYCTIVLKGWQGRRGKAYSREYKKPMYISATNQILLISIWKQHFGNIAWKLVGNTTAKGNVPGSNRNFCSFLFWVFFPSSFFLSLITINRCR